MYPFLFFFYVNMVTKKTPVLKKVKLKLKLVNRIFNDPIGRSFRVFLKLHCGDLQKYYSPIKGRGRFATYFPWGEGGNGVSHKLFGPR